MQASKFRVAICGGGIGGLVLAHSLARYPTLSVAIYEAAPKGAIYGAGIGMWPRTWEVLRKVGLAEKLKKVSLSFPAENDSLAFSFRKSDRREGIEFFNMQGRGMSVIPASEG
ncbi:hypothetical protein PM082_008318 [Marasmius tenuissimus]|nr:hypothetical protein PM082_008318 [Marasmius tenuissimus]